MFEPQLKKPLNITLKNTRKDIAKFGSANRKCENLLQRNIKPDKKHASEEEEVASDPPCEAAPRRRWVGGWVSGEGMVQEEGGWQCRGA